MRVAIQCDSPLLQRSLELFLEGHLSSRRHCEIIIRDRPIRDDEYPTLFISSDPAADLVKPFSKAQLFEALHLSLQKVYEVPTATTEESAVESSNEDRVGFEILEHHIEKLTREYQTNILKAVRAFYEK